MLRPLWNFLISMPYPAWVFTIFVGAALFAVGNLFLPLSKQAEETRIAVRTIEETLKPELRTNLEILQALKNQLQNDAVPFNEVRADGFRTSAWTTISNGQLLLKLRPNIRTSLLSTYGLIYEANDYHKKIVDSMTGITSALGASNNLRNQLRGILLNIIRSIEQPLQGLIQESF